MKIVLAIADDWSGIYVDGTLKYEGHSLSPTNVMDSIGVPHEAVYPDNKWLESIGNLPLKLSDIKQERP